MHVMVGGAHGLLPSGFATTRELTDFYLGLGVERNTKRFRILRSLNVDLSQVVKDVACFGNFF